MRKTNEILIELKNLIKEKGYVYALCMILVEDFHVNLETIHEINPMENISIQEGGLLIGFLIQNEINFTIPDTATDLINMKEKTYALMKELHSSFTKAYFEKLNDELEKKSFKDYETYEKQFFGSGNMLIEPIFYSGSGVYDFQYLEFVEKKYNYDKEWLLENYSFNIPEIKIIINRIKDVLHKKAQKFQVVKVKEFLPSLESKFLEENPKEDFEYLLPILELYPYHELFIDSDSKMGFDVFCKNLVELFVVEKSEIDSPNIKEFFNNFSVNAGNDINSEFQKIGDYNLINSHPIIKLNEERYFVPISFLLFQAVYESPFYWMIKDTTYKDQVAENRGKAGEEISYDFLVKVFGVKNTFKSVKIISDNGKIKTDIDVFCILGSKVLCVQVKSKSLTLLSRQGNDGQIKKDFQGAVQDAFNQGLISRKEILERKSKLFNEDGNEIPLSEDIDDVYIMCVTTEHYPSLSHQSQILLTKNEVDPNPICLSVFDLELLVDYLSDPYDFLYYVRQRVSLMDYFYADEEMSFLGYHLDQKLWKNTHSNFVFIKPSFAQLIDRNYYPLKAGIKISDKGDRIKKRWSDEKFDYISNELKLQKKGKITDILFHLYDLNGDSRENLGKYIFKSKLKTLNDNKNHSFSIVPVDDNTQRVGFSYLCIESDNISELKGRLNSFCELRKYMSKGDIWIGLGCLKSSKNYIDLIYLNEEKWTDNEELKQAAEKMIDGRGQLIKAKKIGRNDICPCGSGVKYKKCCGKL